MKLKTIFAGTAIASLALFSNAGVNIGLPITSVAEAATSVSFSLFYDELGRHGDWTRYRDNYVFIPTGVRRGWKPYTDGHWVYTENHGWTWSSNEPFGWATYHYGRWGYGDDIGWYWVPGQKWAPAWVSWRRNNDYVVWAPLPPRGGDDVSISISAGDIPDFYWVAVPKRNFVDVNLRVAIIDNDRERRRIVERTEFAGAVRIRNNIVVNTVIDVDVIERETGRKIRRLETRRTDNPREARAGDDRVTVFEGEIRRDGDARPQQVREVREVRQVRRDGRRSDDAVDRNTNDNQNNDDRNAPAEAADNNQQGDQNSRRTRRERANTNADANEARDSDDSQEQGTNDNRRRNQARERQPATENDQSQDDDSRNTRRRQRADTDADDGSVAENSQEQGNSSNRRRNRTDAQQPAADDDESRGDNQNTNRQRRRNQSSDRNTNRQDCDPANSDCPQTR
jgi:hypothetical protein